jgi:dethiobiotin synthetase
MTKYFFITGTDTDAGKTYISLGLLNAFKKAGHAVLGLKPIASGCNTDNQNADALALQTASSISVPYEVINPFAFQEAIAPHLACMHENRPIIFDTLLAKIDQSLSYQIDICIIEGAGGWAVPLNDRYFLYDLVKHFQWPVILVINIKLGCLNHAFLTEQAIRHAKLPFAGWVANHTCDKITNSDEIIHTLKKHLTAPCLGEVYFGENPIDKLAIEYL